ncbi:MAG: hypothetical protein GC192_03605 [Bacteroidetes bacterium]|nr:hypothetical protein [Bacteroidota bacterium]
MGRQLVSDDFTSNQYRYQRNGLVAGVYFYQVELDGGGF